MQRLETLSLSHTICFAFLYNPKFLDHGANTLNGNDLTMGKLDRGEGSDRDVHRWNGEGGGMCNEE
jgi:hypothetical protein